MSDEIPPDWRRFLRISHLRAVAVNLLVRAAIQVTRVPASALLPLVAILARAHTGLRHRRGKSPRVIWGPTPLINIKYGSNALRARGYDSVTCVYSAATINSPDDFDIHRNRLLGSELLFYVVGHYLVCAWALFRADVFVGYLDGSFLRHTPLWRHEAQLLHLAGKKLVVSPYGSDIAVVGHLGVAEERLLRDYPEFAEAADAIRERVDCYSRHADLVVRNYQYGYLPRWDVLWPTQLAIDTGTWKPDGAPGSGDGRDGEVVVIHAPNHRNIKGTDVVLEVIEELQAEGLRIRFELLEGRPNEELKRVLMGADIVADQLVVGYATFAVEGLSAGKPVISTLSWMDREVLETESMRANPIVEADLGTLKETLRRLVTNPQERARIGAAGRQFALRFHSLESVGRCWEIIIDHVWHGRPLPAVLPPAELEAVAPRSAETAPVAAASSR